MQFLLQNKLLSDEWLDNTRRLSEIYPSRLVDYKPFVMTIKPDDNNGPIKGNDYIPYGSCNLVDICIRRGYKGVAFDEKTFSYEEYSKNTNTLNKGIILKLQDAIVFFKDEKNDGMWFAKPNKDDKKFTGIVRHAQFFFRMLEDMRRFKKSPGSYGIDDDFEVLIAPPIDIQMEVRWFVVGGKVIDGSMYRAHNQLRKENVTNEPGMLKEAQAFADIWLPHPNVAMDLALVNGELSVVEFNCINSSGFYDNNSDAVFKALWEYYN